MNPPDNTKRCATLQACDYMNHCKFKHTLLSGNVQFFVPQATGAYCDHYQPWMKPWGEGPVEE